MTGLSQLMWMRRKIAERKKLRLCASNTSCKNKVGDGLFSCDYHLKRARDNRKRNNVLYKLNSAKPTFKSMGEEYYDNSE